MCPSEEIRMDRDSVKCKVGSLHRPSLSEGLFLVRTAKSSVNLIVPCSSHGSGPGTPPVKSLLLGFLVQSWGLASPDSKSPRNSPLGPNYDFLPRYTRNLMHFEPRNVQEPAFFINS